MSDGCSVWLRPFRVILDNNTINVTKRPLVKSDSNNMVLNNKGTIISLAVKTLFKSEFLTKSKFILFVEAFDFIFVLSSSSLEIFKYNEEYPTCGHFCFWFLNNEFVLLR